MLCLTLLCASHVPLLCIDKNTFKIFKLNHIYFFTPNFNYVGKPFFSHLEIILMQVRKLRISTLFLEVTSDLYQCHLLSLLLVFHLYHALNANASVEFSQILVWLMFLIIYMVITVFTVTLCYDIWINTVSPLVPLRLLLSRFYQGPGNFWCLFTDTLLVTSFQLCYLVQTHSSSQK